MQQKRRFFIPQGAAAVPRRCALAGQMGAAGPEPVDGYRPPLRRAAPLELSLHRRYKPKTCQRQLAGRAVQQNCRSPEGSRLFNDRHFSTTIYGPEE
jgi:hypothetical protein